MSLKKRKRSYSNIWRLADDLERLNRVGQTMGLSQRNNTSSTATNTKRQRTEMLPLTGEKDVRTVYRKRRMPRRRKRRYLRKLRNYRSLVMRNEPARIFQYVFTQPVSVSANNSNYFGAFYGLCANTYYRNAAVRLFGQFSNGLAAHEKISASHLRIDHMSQDVIIRNVTVPTGTESGIIDLDVYKVVCIRDVPVELWAAADSIEAMIQTMADRLNQAIGMDVEVGDTGTGIPIASSGNVNAVGTKLWNIPTFLRYFRILRQWKVQIPVGGTAQFNMRSSKNKRIAHEEAAEDDIEHGKLAAKAYTTAGYIFNANGRWDRVLEGWSGVNLNMECFTRYNCKPLTPHSDTYVYQT